MKLFQRNSSYLSFKKNHQEVCFYRGKVSLILGIIFIPLFGGLDYFIAHELFSKFILLRLLDTAFVLVILTFVLSSKRLALPLINPLVAIYFTSAGMMIGYMCELLGGVNSSYYAGINLVILAMTVTMPWPGFYTIVAGGTMMGFYLWRVVSLGIGPNEIDHLINNIYFMASTIAISAVSSFLQYRMQFHKFLSEQEILDANEKLKELDKAKTRFFSNLTHEFRTPLVSLAASIQIIRSKVPDDQELRPLLDSSQHSLEDVLDNVNDLLTKTRSDKGMLEMRWSEINVVSFIPRALNVFEPFAAKQNNKLTFTNLLPANHSLDVLPLYVDREKLKKIFNNLVGNAMKFTKGGEIEITLDKTDTHCIIKVRDTGSGIPKEDLELIFDPFTQASNNSMREVQGTGLGLAMVKDFIEKHSGTVTVESEVGKGSTFTVSLPLGDAHVDQTKLDTSEILEGDGDVRINLGLKSFDEIDLTVFSKHDQTRHNILLVEDNPRVLQALAYVLKEYYNLYFARDGLEGLEKIREIRPNLVISDIMMPRMDGYGLVRAIKSDHDLKMIPIILLTSKADVESKIQGFEAGADEYLSKPFNNLEVLTRVRGFIERRKTETEFIHEAKMVALGRFVAGMAHEINNPISFVISSADLVDEIFQAVKEGRISLDEGMESISKRIDHIKDGANRVASITAALKSFVRQGETGFNPNDIHKGIESTILIVHTNRQAKVNFHQHYELEEEIVCNINQLNQVFLVLLDNAVQAFNGRAEGDIWIHTYRQGDFAHITVRDNGPGIPEDIQSRIFDPCFTTKDVGQGTGLGLFIAQQIVHEHGGVFSVKSKVGEGAEFDIQLPIKGQKGQHEQARFTHASIDRGVEKIRYPHR